MTLSRIKIAALAFAAAALSAGTAEAQWYSSVQPSPAPLYSYAQPNRTASQPYAVEVAPGAYVIHRPGEDNARAPRRAYRAAPAPQAKAARPSRVKNDPAMIEQLREQAAGKKTAAKQAAAKPSVINTTGVVYKKPKIVETKRYVDLPPRVVERYTVVDDGNGDNKVEVEAPAAQAQGRKGKPAKETVKDSNKGPNKGPNKGGHRVIQADAEITILGPDRMTIQLYRKGELGKPGARLN
ncbi:MAG TPA: hypothetical protein VNR39_14580 [Pseudolabrys sp.]|nr:hypothetical protein [Pseudolabrys sp.]